MGEQGLETEVAEDDGALWDAQRAGQRSSAGRSYGCRGCSPRSPSCCAPRRPLNARVVGRAAVALYWVTLPSESNAAEGVESLRRRDGPVALRGARRAGSGARGESTSGESPIPGALVLMRRVKQRFDPAGVCAPGLFVGGI